MGGGVFTSNPLTPTLSLSLPVQKERQFSAPPTFVLHLQPKMLWEKSSKQHGNRV